MVRLRKVLWLLWEDSLVAAWVWQGCHTLLICEHLCNLWENILHHKLLWVLWVLWENSLVGSPNLCTSVKSVGGSSPPETSVER